mgnify:CR=1 FL=1
MESNIAFTKSNLMAAQYSLELSLKGFELLDKKRNVLVMNMMGFIDRAEEIQQKMGEIFKEAYEALQVANITMGISSIGEIAQSIPETAGFDIITRSIMDVALKKFQELKYLIYELSEVEDSVYKLAMEVKRTTKRANALQNIQIPKYKEIVKVISEVLEEKEREEFFRLKVVKKKKDQTL